MDKVKDKIEFLKKHLLDEKTGIKWHGPEREQKINELIGTLNSLPKEREITELDKILKLIIREYKGSHVHLDYTVKDINEKISAVIKLLENLKEAPLLEVKEIKNPFDRDLKEFYNNVFGGSFSEDKSASLWEIRRHVARHHFVYYISRKVPKPVLNMLFKDQIIINGYGDEIEGDYHLIVAKVDGVVVGGMIFYSLVTEKLAFGFIDYLIVSFKGFKGTGKKIDERYRHLAAKRMNEDCIHILQKDAKKYSNNEISCILTEVENPYKLKREDYAGLGIKVDPRLTMQLFMGIGYRLVDFDYIQPPLDEGLSEVRHLALMIHTRIDDWIKNGLPSLVLDYFFMTAFVEWEHIDYKSDKFIAKMRENTDKIEKGTKRIRLISPEELGFDTGGTLEDFSKVMGSQGKRL